MTISDIDTLCVRTIRCLAADMVQAANSGHPGAPMGCAAMAHALFGYIMKYDPSDPSWWNRDRFVLSNGHACALLYSMLHLTGYEVSLDDLKKFRQMNSITPGHPEAGMTPGVEVSTGPLGQGISNAVGLAIGQAMLAGQYGSDAFNNFTFVICGDGCLQEGVSYEACALAGHLGLGRLIVLYDDNEITIDGSTELSFTENVNMRFAAQNWEVIEVSDGTSDVHAIFAAVEKAKQNLAQPTLIKIRTTIGVDSSKAGSEKSHGSPLGPEEIKKIKTMYGFDPETSFHVPEDVREFYKSHVKNAIDAKSGWKQNLESENISAELTDRFSSVFSTSALLAAIPAFDEKPKATRQYSGEVLASLVKAFPAIVGGSADLTESTVTNKANLAPFTKSTPENRFIHFGVREHAMAAVCNGLAAYGGFTPFCATFANFIGYCWGSVRLSALSHHKVLYIATHDSIDLGEDGPTHQPIEILPLLRGTPGIQAIRPADGNETRGAYLAHLRAENKGPSVLLLSRGAVPPLEGSCAEKVLSGAYILQDFAGQSVPRVIMAGSGTEVTLLVEARKLLATQGVDARVVSFPSWDLFDKQSCEYQKSVFPDSVPSIYVEAANCLGAEKYVRNGSIGMSTFGASAPAKDLKKHFGFTVENIVKKAMKAVGK
jgi:transketolase